MRDFGIDPASSVVIGDSPSDMEAGKAAGVRGIFVTSPREETPPGYAAADSLLAAARLVTEEGR